MQVNCSNIIETLPNESIFQIFSYLGVKDLEVCSRVNRVWREIASDNVLWQDCFPEITFPENVSIKQYINTHFVTSEKEVLDYIKKFISTIPVDAQGIFTCVFPFNSPCEIKISFLFKNKIFNDRPIIKENIFFLKQIKYHKRCYKKRNRSRPYYLYFMQHLWFTCKSGHSFGIKVTLPPTPKEA